MNWSSLVVHRPAVIGTWKRSSRYEPRLLEEPQMLRHCDPRHGVLLGQRSERLAVAGKQGVEQRSPGWIRQCAENRLHVLDNREPNGVLGRSMTPKLTIDETMEILRTTVPRLKELTRGVSRSPTCAPATTSWAATCCGSCARIIRRGRGCRRRPGRSTAVAPEAHRAHPAGARLTPHPCRGPVTLTWCESGNEHAAAASRSSPTRIRACDCRR